jgi:hypothetical protein
VSATHKNTINPLLKGKDDVVRRDASTAHDPNNPDIGRVLQPTDPSQVSSRVCSPGTQKADDLGFKVLAAHDDSFLA